MSSGMLSMGDGRVVTVDEYRRLKRHLFNLRCQHALLIRSLQEKGETKFRRKQLDRLGRRILEVELEIAFSRVAFPDEYPLTPRSLWKEAKTRLAQLRQAYANRRNGMRISLR